MDKRNGLAAGTILPFPGLPCTVLTEKGRGSNSIVYMGEYTDAQFPDCKHQVLIKELFPYHPDGEIWRDESGSVCWESSAKKTMEIHRASFLRGNEIHLYLLKSYPAETEANINTYALNQTLYSVLGFSGARSLDKELSNHKNELIPVVVHIRRILNTLAALDTFHQAGYLHLDLSPDNILLIGDGRRERVSLIDYNSVHTLKELQAGSPFFFSEKEGYTSPEVRAGRIDRVGPWSDLYSLTAVFYTCLTGRALSILETSQAGPPDFSGTSSVGQLPAPATSLLKRILARGLATPVSRRYSNSDEMRQDLEELQDRIEGKGITHWALWESARTGLRDVLKMNSSYQYILEQEKLYPLQYVNAGGKTGDFLSFVNNMVSSEGQSTYLLAGGGAGKTTSLLAAAVSQKEEYSPSEPVFLYLSLYGWKDGENSYLIDRILESLRFKPETENMEMARHELYLLLSSPLHTKWGERPQLLLLLDGFNEVQGDPDPLLKEIVELNALSGIRICVTGRSDVNIPGLSPLRLKPLSTGEVQRILAQNGLLLPEDEGVRQALTTPFLLSLYITTANQREKQLLLHSQGELIDAFFSSLIEKAESQYPEDERSRWQAEAAVYFVLPEIAYTICTKGTPLPDRLLLPIVEKCWKHISARQIRKVFPQWAGHFSAIQGEARSADDWYEIMVHKILWRRMGLLVRNRNGSFRLFHSMLEENLLRRRAVFHQMLARRQRHWAAVLVLSCLLVAGGVYRFGSMFLAERETVIEEMPQPYDEQKADIVLGAGIEALVYAANQCEEMEKYLALLRENPADIAACASCEASCIRAIKVAEADNAGRKIRRAEELMTTGEVMPWSGIRLDIDLYTILVNMPGAQAERYRKCLSAIGSIRTDSLFPEAFAADYLDALSSALKADADLLRKIFEELLEPEYSRMKGNEALEIRMQYKAVGDTLAAIEALGLDTIQTAEYRQRTAWNAILANPVSAMAEKEEDRTE